MRRALLIFIVVLVVNFIFSYFFTTPKMWRLRESAAQSVERYETLQSEIVQLQERIAVVSAREKNLYRSIFSADSVAFEAAAYYMPSLYHFGRYNDLVHSTEKMLSDTREQIYRASVSLDDIELLALNKDVMAERVPAIWPVDKRLLRGNIGAFGWRIHPTLGGRKMHEGIDLSGDTGTPIVATGNGTASVENRNNGYGKQVIIDHGFGYKTRYAHLSKIDVVNGQEVKRGQKIGEMGSTGRSSGPHLHYEVIYRGTPVNPLNYSSRDMSGEEFQAILENMRNITYELDDGAVDLKREYTEVEATLK